MEPHAARSATLLPQLGAPFAQVSTCRMVRPKPAGASFSLLFLKEGALCVVFCSVLFCSVVFCSVLFCCVLFCSVLLSCVVLCCVCVEEPFFWAEEFGLPFSSLSGEMGLSLLLLGHLLPHNGVDPVEEGHPVHEGSSKDEKHMQSFFPCTPKNERNSV